MAASWQDSLQRGKDWFDQRPIRERGLITGTALVLLLFVGWELAIAPALKENQVLETRLATLKQSRDRLLVEQQTLFAQMEKDPSGELRNQLQLRQERLLSLDQRIADKTSELIAPRAMVSLLREILVAQQGLRLKSLELKAPEPVYEPGAAEQDSAKETQPGSPLLYAHDVELKVEGSYLNVLAYLRRLESLNEGLGWVVLEYDAENWPAGEARIQVRTLSLEPAWLGV